MHILVVEDERKLCDTIVRSLNRLAYSVDYCYDGQSAMEMLAFEKFDLVVLDLNLPGADGMTVLKTLRQNDYDTKVLILEHLMLNQGRPVSQEELIEHVWESTADNFSNSIRVHISALRKKLRTALGYDPIHNRVGEGYVMEDRK